MVIQETNIKLKDSYQDLILYFFHRFLRPAHLGVRLTLESLLKEHLGVRLTLESLLKDNTARLVLNLTQTVKVRNLTSWLCQSAEQAKLT